MNHLAIMYHYVQPKGLKGIVPLEPKDFKQQLEWVTERYHVVSPDDLFRGSSSKPSCVLTFDDATKDQYEVAFDILQQKGLPAYFTVLSGPLTRRVIPVVHLVHSVLSYYSDDEIWSDLNDLFPLDHIADVIGNYYAYEQDQHRRYNKYALNCMLTGEQSRTYLESKLTTKFGTVDDFINKYYITIDEWHRIKEAGMTIGAHAVNHRAYSGDAKDFFNEEIAPCRDFIRSEIGVDPKWYTPAFGGGIAYKEMMDGLEPILRNEGFFGGFTTQHGYIHQEAHSFWLKRIDCVHLPPMREV